MKCPICQNETKVTNSRSAEQGQIIKRRRACTKCDRRFTTYERLELIGLEVVKRDGSKEFYQRNKLRDGLTKALEKRPCTEEEFQQLISRIERDIFNLETDLISTDRIGQIVLLHLKEFDKVAYLRFASVHRNFRSTKAFEKEIQKLEKATSRIR